MTKINQTLLHGLGMIEEEYAPYNLMWVSEIKYLGTNVGVRKIQDPNTGRLSLVIVLDSETKKNHLNKALNAIFKERDRLSKFQGPDHLINFYDYILQLHLDNQYCTMGTDDNVSGGFPFSSKLQYRNANSRELMWDMNFDALVYLLRSSKNDGDNSKFAKYCFYDLLRLMNYGDKRDIESLYEGSLKELIYGDCPWNIDGEPIVKDKVENKLELLVKKHGREARFPESKQERIRIYGFFLVWSDWTFAMSLLEKSYPDTYEKYKPRFDARTSEILSQQQADTQKDLHEWSEEQFKFPD